MFGNHLFIIYTVIFMAISSVTHFSWVYQKVKEMPTRDRAKIGLLTLIFVPIVFFGMYMAFAMIYRIANFLFGDSDLLIVHAITNAPNFYVLYVLIQEIKERKQK